MCVWRVCGGCVAGVCVAGGVGWRVEARRGGAGGEAEICVADLGEAERNY